jgi:hypothetical protein
MKFFCGPGQIYQIRYEILDIYVPSIFTLKFFFINILMDSIKNELIVYKQKLKFADEVWENKGLIPPDKSVSATLQSKFDQIIDNIIELKNEASTNKQLSDVIKKK